MCTQKLTETSLIYRDIKIKGYMKELQRKAIEQVEPINSEKMCEMRPASEIYFALHTSQLNTNVQNMVTSTQQHAGSSHLVK